MSEQREPLNIGTPCALEEIQLLNQWPHRQVGFCLRCGEYYTLAQLRLPDAKRQHQAGSLHVSRGS